MAVTKRTRYEVLRRDSNTCRYCGGSAPDVVLTIDHVTPVSLGGSDDPSNLVAACKDCNAGKASSNPDGATVANANSAAVRWAAAVEASARETLAKVNELNDVACEFFDLWKALSPSYRMNELPGDWESSLHKWIALGLPYELIESAARNALSRPGLPNYARFRYMAKICWSELTEIQNRALQLLEKQEDAYARSAAPATWNEDSLQPLDFAVRLADMRHPADQILVDFVDGRLTA